MRILSTRTHGYLDYIVGLLLILAPFLFDFATGGPEMWLPVILGAAAIVYSFFTDYELGGVRNIPMPTHLTLDLISGLLLAVSPWLLGFAEVVWVPHLLVGLFEILASLMTRRTPATTTRQRHVHA